MSSHDFTITIYLSIVACGAGLSLMSRRSGSRFPAFGTLMSWTMSTRTRRVGVIITWAWLGLHFFAR
jgi:hypothetical protein